MESLVLLYVTSLDDLYFGSMVPLDDETLMCYGYAIIGEKYALMECKR